MSSEKSSKIDQLAEYNRQGQQEEPVTKGVSEPEERVEHAHERPEIYYSDETDTTFITGVVCGAVAVCIGYLVFQGLNKTTVETPPPISAFE